ncbi:MAG TPA: carbonic anhydrase [Candidatus Dormibacteraeota bacterium]|nr:carbonic anhydrase [Candidatus Dormibacteraeota bacterium]
MSNIDLLLLNNHTYAATFAKGYLSHRPSRPIAIVTCMDARIDVHRALGLEEGEVHVIRNAGGVVTEDVIRSLLISQRLLGTREVMVLHHTNCGMQTFTDDAMKRQIEAETGIRPPFALEAFPDLEQDVRQSVTRIKASPFVSHKDAVRGFIYDVGRGTVQEVR